MAGVRYLPLHWYEDGEVLPPTELLDEEGRKVDDDGLPVIDTEDEIIAVANADENRTRDPKAASMPRTSAVLSDASTDSEIGPGTYRKRAKGRVSVPPPPPPTPEADEEVCFPIVSPMCKEISRKSTFTFRETIQERVMTPPRQRGLRLRNRMLTRDLTLAKMSPQRELLPCQINKTTTVTCHSSRQMSKMVETMIPLSFTLEISPRAKRPRSLHLLSQLSLLMSLTKTCQ